MLASSPAGTPEKSAQHWREALLEYQATLENAWVGIAFTRDRNILHCNPRFSEIFGWPHGDLTGQPGLVLYPSAEAYSKMGRVAGPLLAAGEVYEGELTMRRMDGSTFLAHVHAKAIDAANTRAGTIWIAEDITERRAAETRLQNLLLEQQAILKNASVSIVFTQNGVIMHCNPRAEEMYGWAPGTLIGQPAAAFFVDADDYARFGAQAGPILAAGKQLDIEWRNARKDGSTFWCRNLAKAIERGDGEQNTIWITEDISQRKATEEALRRAHDEMEQRVRDRTLDLANANARLHAEVEERQQAEERVRHMANHDALTGLPNRRLLHDRLRQAIALAHRRRNKVAVMFIDLDRFKNINDSLGHVSGDALLQQVGKRISTELREGDTVARLGGDEFVIVLPELGDANDAAIVAHKLTGAFVAPFAIAGVEVHISPSIGIAIYPDDGTDPETLTRNADTAMYHAKDMGRNNHQFFTDQMNVAAAQRFALENKLHSALDRDELRLHYQPRIAIDTRRACGFEALLRWHDPDQGMIAPSSFIPVAEDSSLIVPIGKWVLREVCRQHMAWRAAGYAPLPIAVNLSPREFRQPDLVDSVARALADSGMEARYLTLEITEGSLMQATVQTLETLEALNALGVGLSIDDFGVGYSSLSYLKRFPVDQLKIDQSFVRDIATDPDDAAIVSAIIGLARNLQLSVVAEGVETEAQLAFIAASGCNEAQGFFFSQPLPAEEAAQRFLATLH